MDITTIKPKLNPETIAQIFFVLAIVFMFFPIRYVFPTIESFKTGAYSDFTSISLYLSDIFLILSFLFILPRGIFTWKRIILPLILALWLVLANIFHTRTSFNWFFLAKYLELALVAYGTSLYLFKNTNFREKILHLFLILGSFESLLSISQFITQKSLGLNKLGEQVIASNLSGISKIIVNGETYIRSYGTFPHPNLLSAFLLTTLAFGTYLFIRAGSLRIRILLGISILINIIGLTLTFSRAAFLGFFVFCTILFLILYFKGLWDRKVSVALIIICGSIFLSLIIFKPFLLTRATINDNASLERIFYTKIGLKIIKTHPVIGDGLGQSVLDMQTYSPIKLPPWQIQPVHNYFILAAAEIGIVGAGLFLLFFLIHVKHLASTIIKNRGEDIMLKVILLSLFIGFLVLMQFDHYFYTIEQTQLLLWFTLGLIASETKNYL